MRSNFGFLRPEYLELFEPAAGAEQLVHSDPRACCMRTRHALEQAVHWLYTHDRDLRMPYDNSLGVLLTQPAFEKLLPPHIHDKARLIQKLGNQAVHGNGRVGHLDALRLVRELFHVLFWLARTYTRASDPKTLAAEWDDKRVPQLVRADEAVRFTRDELKKQEATFRERIEAQHAEIEAREARIAEAAASLAEREALLAEVNAELARVREELAKAKATSFLVPDTHDYDEAETRRLFIDVLLREAGWEVGANASAEVLVGGMVGGSGDGFADYVLWGADGKPLAVVEAKKSLADPEVGRQQAKRYADGLEKAHGQRPLIYYTNGHATWLWDDRRAPPREVQGFFTREELDLAIQRRSMQADPRGLQVDTAIAGRSYQVRAIRSMAEALASGRRAGLLTMATGTGKTRMSIALVDLLMRANWVRRVLFLADRRALVKQATNAFKANLPHSSPVNLLDDRDGQGRVYLSTYPTMMGLIEEMDGAKRRYGVGHFDLIVIDEAHRSVYQKYGAIFRYFDSYLVGLTATPRDEVDRDTYRLFGLETGVPTDAYGLDEAVADGYLVPPTAYDVPLKFARQGVKYDELSEEEKEHVESLDWGEHAADWDDGEVHASAINKWLFNENTVDRMLQHLMEHGLKVEGGDRLGKTIIFAVNQKHAEFIAQRFDHHYPHYNGEFARVITHAVKFAETLIDDFSVANKAPHIAISVDMLDTGIDVPEVLNLVFFKTVRSKVKFLQMIGRGTRLCPDLFGPGLDKTEFAILDFCGNFEFFNQNPRGATSAVALPLGTRVFRKRLELLGLLSDDAANAKRIGEPRQEYGAASLRDGLVERLHGEVAAMNMDNFIVRPKRAHVSRFADRAQWEALDGHALADLHEHVAGLPSTLEGEHVTARLFDLLCLNLQLALLQGTGDFLSYCDRLKEAASELETFDAIPAVKAELALIQEVQTDAFWTDVTAEQIDHVRRRLRALVRFVERKPGGPVYTLLTDEIGEAQPVQLGDFSSGINLVQYRRKVEAYIRANENHIAIAKLRLNKPLTPTDLAELERFVFESDVVGGREQFVKGFGEGTSLTAFIRSLVGMDRAAAKEAFGRFLDETRYSSQQIRFVEMIVDRLTRHGRIDPGQLYEPPFTGLHYEGVGGMFPSGDVESLIGIIQQIEEQAA